MAHWGLKEWLPSFRYFGVRTWWYLPTRLASKAFSFSASDACTWATSFWDNLRPLRHEGWVFAHVWARNLGAMQKLVFSNIAPLSKSLICGLQHTGSERSQYIHFNQRNKGILQDFYLQSWIHVLNQSMLTPQKTRSPFQLLHLRLQASHGSHLPPKKK